MTFYIRVVYVETQGKKVLKPCGVRTQVCNYNTDIERFYKDYPQSLPTDFLINQDIFTLKLEEFRKLLQISYRSGEYYGQHYAFKILAKKKRVSLRRSLEEDDIQF